MKKYKYMHTINGHPAHYYPGQQVCYATRTRPIPLCDDLNQIKREQRASEAWRKKELGTHVTGVRYGWMKVRTP